MIICGTGHRPDKLGGYSKAAHAQLVQIAWDWLRVRRKDITCVITGGALGWDQALAEAARRLRIPYTMAIPFEGFENKWPDESQLYLHYLCDNATDVVFVCEAGYAPWKMQKRNEWMVNESELVLAMWNGTDGGTANCVRYAEKLNRPITNLWERYEETASPLDISRGS